MLAGVQRRQEQARGVGTDTGAQQLIDLDDHRARHDQIAAEAGDELGREAVRLVAPVRGRDQRPGVSDDPQRAETRSVR